MRNPWYDYSKFDDVEFLEKHYLGYTRKPKPKNLPTRCIPKCECKDD